MPREFNYATQGERVPSDVRDNISVEMFKTLFARREAGVNQHNDENLRLENTGDLSLNPRMAYKLFRSAWESVECMEYDLPVDSHPPVCEDFFRKKKWVNGYLEC